MTATAAARVTDVLISVDLLLRDVPRAVLTQAAAGALEHLPGLLIVPRRPLEPVGRDHAHVAAVLRAEVADVLQAVLPAVEDRQVVERLERLLPGLERDVERRLAGD